MAKERKKTVASLQELADLAGVSRATASRALNDNPMISEKTRARVQALAAEHSFSINRQARAFRLRRSNLIAVVFMLDVKSDQHMSDPFFLEMLGGIADALAERDYDLLLTHAPVTDVLGLRNGRAFQQADGIIFIGQGEQHDALNELTEEDTPFVVWGGPVGEKRYILVGGDNHGGGHAATRHLLDAGRRRIAFFGNTRNPEIAARHAGYAAALAERGLEPDPELTVDVPFDMPHARDVTSRLLETARQFDGVVCASDVIALAAISTFAALGVRVPDDIAVVGYDDVALASYSSPALTTVRQNIRWAGRVLVESVLGLVNGDDVTDTQLQSELVVRDSSMRRTGGSAPE